ncbi:hypothetical protein PCANC_23131 [Puccinia coronata f. sp. avenae]|uniref:Dynein light intermediate chain n=1 Tax=Puccinia coronata f. sp. avenae TaxID=200324 RepID=A0A2N5TN00_9BASI|nr:hypothetical protein PCASD_23013 [Puccinia coronata f. sp. avenae]PLW31240.1 hypothetical protein PCANC_23131 [Puccinia coronata f. sp. avenae]
MQSSGANGNALTLQETVKMNYDQLLPGEGNLWSSILDSVSNNREKSTLPTKKLIILGERNSGKSTIASYLSSTTSPSADQNNTTTTTAAATTTATTTTTTTTTTTNTKTAIQPATDKDDDDVDLGTSYTTVEIGDDGDDDPLVRLSLHQIPSALPPYSHLLPLILNADSLRESLILVLIPFSHPHSLLTSLVRWLILIRSVIKSIKDTIKPAEVGQPAERGEYIIEECKEALEYQYRSYLEPAGPQLASSLSAETGEATSTGGNATIHLDLPLPPGTLTENMGVGIVVVCTKSDEIDQLEKEKDFKEEQFDFIQQVLRSICLRFGGALFFTSQKKAESLVRLRAYVLHRLFGQLVSAAPAAAGTAAAAAAAAGAQAAAAAAVATAGTSATTNARLFPFPYKANVVDRDEVLIPMGWDSWGKIKILRDGFDPLVVGNGWLFDLEKPARCPLLPLRPADDRTESQLNIVDDQVGYDSEGRKIVSACKLWEDMIGETDDEAPLINPHDRVTATQEQHFLKSKYEVLKKERDMDPRSYHNKGHSSHQQPGIKFTNGTSVLADKNGGGGSDGMNTAGADEEINAQLTKLALRDQQGGLNGRSATASLSPVELIHRQQQQQQQQQQGQPHETPRNKVAGGSTSVGGTQQTKGLTTHTAASSPLASRSGPFPPGSQQQQHGMGGPPGSAGALHTPAGSQGEKAMLANFFGKLLDKDPVGARGLAANPLLKSSSSSHTATSSTAAPNDPVRLRRPSSGSLQDS